MPEIGAYDPISQISESAPGPGNMSSRMPKRIETMPDTISSHSFSIEIGSHTDAPSYTTRV
jgi:hypothetical protein